MRLHEQAATRKAKLEALEEEIVHFRQHLGGPKFTGTERVKCTHPDCDETVEERKDWISTTDVIRWLDGIVTLTRE